MELIKRHSMLLMTVFLLGLSCWMMSVSVRNKALPQFGANLMGRIIAPTEKLRFELSQSFNFYWKRYFYLLEVEAERDDLSNRIKALEAQNSRLVEFENENRRMRALLGYTEETGVKGVAATVIGRNPSNWTRSVTINRGASHGIRPGHPVVDGHAIVGQVIAVSPSAASVLLLTDNTAAVDALVQASRASGVVEGIMQDKLIMRYVTKDYQVSLGDRIISSGLDGVFPKGKLIGIVVKVGEDKIGMFKSIEVEPSVDFNRLENVLVLLTEERELPEVGKEVKK